MLKLATEMTKAIIESISEVTILGAGLTLSELASVLVRFDHVARFIVNADQQNHNSALSQMRHGL
jgi:hypothetical protein